MVDIIKDLSVTGEEKAGTIIIPTGIESHFLKIGLGLGIGHHRVGNINLLGTGKIRKEGKTTGEKARKSQNFLNQSIAGERDCTLNG